MAFRIRKTDVDYDNIKQFQKEYEANDKLYREHLKNISQNKDRDLWKYFYWDTFHDGYIEKVSFWETPGNITFHMSCPNIKKRRGDSHQYISPSIEFECHFRNVVYFSYEHDDFHELANQLYCSSFEFLYSEIDTLTEIIEKHKTFDEDGEGIWDYHSLIMKVMAGDTSFYIEMVFSQVDIYPKEPIAFELMLASDDFYVPIYREDENIEKLPEWISKSSGMKIVLDDDEE